MKTAIVTAADHGYFGLASELLDSLERVRGEDKGGTLAGLDVCLLDVGLLAEQRRAMEKRVTRVVSPGWDFDFPGREQCRSWYQAMTARPYLPKHFPEYDRYVWLDSDVWMQNSQALELLLLTSQAPTLVIVPEVHCTYGNIYTARDSIVAHLHKIYAGGFGEAAAGRYATMAPINSGVFAAQKNLPFWQVWAKTLERALQNCLSHWLEQCALNAAIFDGRIAFYPLPAWCNWITQHSVPMLDLESGQLYGPTMPHELLSIIHLVGLKFREADVPCSDGSTQKMALNYAAMLSRARRASPAAKEAGR